MRVTDQDLLAGALARAYAFADVGLLRRALLRVEAADQSLSLLDALEVEGSPRSNASSKR